MSRLRALTAKTLRLTAYLTGVAFGLGAIGARTVQAKGQKAALAIGESLGGLEDAPGGGTTLTVNGHTLHLASAHLDASLDEVLTRAQKGCETHAEGMADDFADLESAFRREPGTRGYPGIGVLRDRREGHGVVSCFAPDAPSGPVETMKRMSRFAQSRDLADLGGLRYLTARAEEGGTRVMATWADGHIDIGAIFAADGDAPGEDPSMVPRPAGARRVLSARVMPAPYGAYLYATDERALAAYDSALALRGFERVASDGDRRAYRRGLVDVMVTSTTSSPSSDGGTTLSIVESHFAQVQAQGTPER